MSPPHVEGELSPRFKLTFSKIVSVFEADSNSVPRRLRQRTLSQCGLSSPAQSHGMLITEPGRANADRSDDIVSDDDVSDYEISDDEYGWSCRHETTYGSLAEAIYELMEKKELIRVTAGDRIVRNLQKAYHDLKRDHDCFSERSINLYNNALDAIRYIFKQKHWADCVNLLDMNDITSRILCTVRLEESMVGQFDHHTYREWFRQILEDAAWCSKPVVLYASTVDKLLEAYVPLHSTRHGLLTLLEIGSALLYEDGYSQVSKPVVQSECDALLQHILLAGLGRLRDGHACLLFDPHVDFANALRRLGQIWHQPCTEGPRPCYHMTNAVALHYVHERALKDARMKVQHVAVAYDLPLELEHIILNALLECEEIPPKPVTSIASPVTVEPPHDFAKHLDHSQLPMQVRQVILAPDWRCSNTTDGYARVALPKAEWLETSRLHEFFAQDAGGRPICKVAI